MLNAIVLWMKKSIFFPTLNLFLKSNKSQSVFYPATYMFRPQQNTIIKFLFKINVSPVLLVAYFMIDRPTIPSIVRLTTI